MEAGNHLFAIGDNVIRAYDLGDASEVGSCPSPACSSTESATT